LRLAASETSAYASAMLPRLSTEPALDATYRAFLGAVRGAGFAGDILSDYGSRLVHATDNSVYQIVPQAVVCPRAHDDVVTLARVAAEPRFQPRPFRSDHNRDRQREQGNVQPAHGPILPQRTGTNPIRLLGR